MSVRFTSDRRAAARAAAAQAAQEGLRDAAEFVLEQANRTVPIEEGTLGGSGSVSVEDGRASVAYDTAYAVRQHEDLTLRHDQGRRAKWLELTLREQSSRIARFLGDRIRRAL